MIVHQIQSWWKIDEKWWILIDLCTPNQIWGSTGFSNENIKFGSKLGREFSTTPCTGDINTWSTSQVDFSTHSGNMDKPSWCLTNREEVQKNLPLKCVCNNPRPFLFQFPPENHDFDDLGKVVMTWGWIFWIWCVHTARGDEYVPRDVWTVVWRPLDRI